MPRKTNLLQTKSAPCIAFDMSDLVSNIDTLSAAQLDELSDRIAYLRSGKQRKLSPAEEQLWQELKVLYPLECGGANPYVFIRIFGVEKYLNCARYLDEMAHQACGFGRNQRTVRDGVRRLLLTTLKEYLGNAMLYTLKRAADRSFDNVKQFIIEEKDLRADKADLLLNKLEKLEKELEKSGAAEPYSEKPFVGPYRFLRQFGRMKHAIDDAFPGYLDAGILAMAITPLPRSD